MDETSIQGSKVQQVAAFYPEKYNTRKPPLKEGSHF